jgi:hypothetical protein
MASSVIPKSLASEISGMVKSKELFVSGRTSVTIGIPNSRKLLFVAITSTINEAYASIVLTTGAGAVRQLEIAKGTNVTVDVSVNNEITLTYPSTAYPYFMIFSPNDLSEVVVKRSS